MFSLVIITKNEVKNLARLLPEVSDWADEIIIYDNSDREQSQSALLAKQHGAKFYPSPLAWAGFGVQRQRAQALAQHDWILMLDADEIPDKAMKNAITRITQQTPQDTIYGMRRIDYIGSSAIDSPRVRLKPYWRLYPKRFGFDNTLVHESLQIEDAQTEVLDGYAHHYTSPDVAFWLRKRLAYALAWADERKNRPKRFGWSKIMLHSFGSFLKQYVVDKRCLCGKAGLITACLFAQYTFNKYALLYAEQRGLSTWYPQMKEQLEHALQNPEPAVGWKLPCLMLKRFVQQYRQASSQHRLFSAVLAAHHAFNQRVQL
ncbi:MAG: glycosyltransferase family 2 protein [Cardiobacteriaceae bacterium]|nr:glycosyltransferase family 2 protein [Cardiobacteriaceae bacterium]